MPRTIGSPYLTPKNRGIADAIVALRKARGLSQAEVVEAMKDRGAEWTTNTMWALESGSQSLRAAEAGDLAAILGVEVANLVTPQGATNELAVAALSAVREVTSAEEQLRSATLHYARALRESRRALERARALPLWAELPQQIRSTADEAVSLSAADVVADELGDLSGDSGDENRPGASEEESSHGR